MLELVNLSRLRLVFPLQARLAFRDTCPGGLAWSGRHPFKVKSMGSNPIQGTEQTTALKLKRLSTASKQEEVGSIPTGATELARWWNGRHAVLRRPCPPGMRVQVPPWSLLANGVCGVTGEHATL